jgi:hypothetical protein
MPDKEKEAEEKTETEEVLPGEPQEKKPEIPTEQPTQRAHPHQHSPGKAGVLLAIIGIIVVVFGVGVLATQIGDSHHNRLRIGPMMEVDRGEFHHGMMRGGGSQVTNQIRLSGVVTAVSDSSFTIAGGGTTNTIQTNSSTQYSGDSKASVNDTVIVVGTTSNSVFTATQVVINP